jgi:hypothetical protein
MVNLRKSMAQTAVHIISPTVRGRNADRDHPGPASLEESFPASDPPWWTLGPDDPIGR